jgi:two-component system cell cycle response regulator
MPTPDNSYRVLLIEADPNETEVYSDLIREVADCTVDVVNNADNSFEWISASNYHLVVVDASASELDGLGIVEQIKWISPVTSVILVSERASIEQAVAAIRLGAEDYLEKPFNIESFRLAVKRGLDKKALFGTGNSDVSQFFNLLNSCQMISASLDQGKIFNVLRSYLSRELDCDHTAIYSITPSDDPANQAVKMVEGNFDRAMQEIMDIVLQASNPLPKMVAANEYSRFVDRSQLTPGLFVFRFRCLGSNEYFCVCLSPERPTVPDAFESRLRMLKAQVEATGKNIERYQGVQNLVYVDDATGLYNTRYLNQILDREIAQSRSSGKPFAVLFVDADKFKGVNDNHGHLVGTKLLNELGEQIKKFVRDKDTVFRYGGDEFVAVLSACDLATAGIVAERIRSAVERHDFLSNEGLALRFTVSIGVALFPDHASSKREIIDAADRAMYDAKKRTRNSVTIAAVGVKRPRAL